MFLAFRCDLHERMLYREEPGLPPEPVPLGARAYDLLLLFLQRPGALITKNEIFAAVWADAAVEDSNLTVQMSALRRVLDAGRDGPSCIQTLPGRGYRFLPEIRSAPEPQPDPGPDQASDSVPPPAPPPEPAGAPPLVLATAETPPAAAPPPSHTMPEPAARRRRPRWALSVTALVALAAVALAA